MNQTKTTPSKLPPLSDDIFDGEHQSTQFPKELPRCNHEKIVFKNGELRCPCGVAYQGSHLQEIYTLLHRSG